MQNIEKTIADFIENNNSSFELDGNAEELDIKEDPLLFFTRDNGNVGDETYGKEDLQEALDLKKKLLEKFNNIKVDVEPCDEWVHLTVYSTD